MLNNSLSSRKKKAVLAYVSIVGVAAVLAYLLFPSNPVVAASVLAVSPILICPIICGTMGLLIWFSSRQSGK